MTTLPEVGACAGQVDPTDQTTRDGPGDQPRATRRPQRRNAAFSLWCLLPSRGLRSSWSCTCILRLIR
jgi:hypothetical protein